jgi:hypothetical protein
MTIPCFVGSKKEEKDFEGKQGRRKRSSTGMSLLEEVVVLKENESGQTR